MTEHADAPQGEGAPAGEAQGNSEADPLAGDSLLGGKVEEGDKGGEEKQTFIQRTKCVYPHLPRHADQVIVGHFRASSM